MTHLFKWILAVQVAFLLVALPGHASKPNLPSKESENYSLPQDSIFLIEDYSNSKERWVNQDGKTKSLRDFQGKISIVSMIYTGCQFSCPLIIAKMKSIEAALPNNLKSEVQFLLFSFDPARDTVAQIKKKVLSHKLNPNNWQILTGTIKNVSELAAALDFKYKKLENGDFNHSNELLALNQDGVIFHKMHNLDLGLQDLLVELKKALKLSELGDSQENPKDLKNQKETK